MPHRGPRKLVADLAVGPRDDPHLAVKLEAECVDHERRGAAPEQVRVFTTSGGRAVRRWDGRHSNLEQRGRPAWCKTTVADIRFGLDGPAVRQTVVTALDAFT
jgi:hypothetical protein